MKASDVSEGVVSSLRAEDIEHQRIHQRGKGCDRCKAADVIDALSDALAQIGAETDTVADFEGIRFRNFALARLRGETANLWADRSDRADAGRGGDGSMILETGKLEPDYAIPMILHCPECGERHLDEGEFAEAPHHTHACQGCGFVWRPAKVNTHGVRFLPGYRNQAQPVDAPTPPA